jgi:hypothetical protein
MTRPPSLGVYVDKDPNFLAERYGNYCCVSTGKYGQRILYFQKSARALVENRMGYIFE